MSRPSASAKHKRPHLVSVRMDASEYEKLERVAASLKVSLSEAVRMLVKRARGEKR